MQKLAKCQKLQTKIQRHFEKRVQKPKISTAVLALAAPLVPLTFSISGWVIWSSVIITGGEPLFCRRKKKIIRKLCFTRLFHVGDDMSGHITAYVSEFNHVLPLFGLFSFSFLLLPSHCTMLQAPLGCSISLKK